MLSVLLWKSLPSQSFYLLCSSCPSPEDCYPAWSLLPQTSLTQSLSTVRLPLPDIRSNLRVEDLDGEGSDGPGRGKSLISAQVRSRCNSFTLPGVVAPEKRKRKTSGFIFFELVCNMSTACEILRINWWPCSLSLVEHIVSHIIFLAISWQVFGPRGECFLYLSEIITQAQ